MADGQLGPFLCMWRSEPIVLHAMLRKLTGEQRGAAVALGRAVQGTATLGATYMFAPYGSKHLHGAFRTSKASRYLTTTAAQPNDIAETDRTQTAFTTEMIPFMKKYPLPQEDVKQIVRLIARANTDLAALQTVPDMEANVRKCEAQVLDGALFFV